MLVAGAAFVAYLFTLGYGIYLKTYWVERPARRSAKPPSPLLRWMLTILALGVFGVTVGTLFPDLTQSYAGELFVMTVVFGGIALGLISSVTAGQTSASEPARGGSIESESAPAFWRLARNLIGIQIGAVALGVFFLGPVFLLHYELNQYIDVPACQRRCASNGYAYQDLIARKSTYDCRCVDREGLHVFHERAYVGGGRGTRAAIVDWCVRFGATLLVGLGWPALVLGMGYVLWWRRRRRS
jgi:hypothetical protein